MAISDDKISITVAIDKEVKKQLEKYSKDLDTTVSKLSRNLICYSLRETAIEEKIGLHYLGKHLINFLDSLPKPIKETLKWRQNSIEVPVDISVVIEKDIKNELDRYSNKFGISLKRFARNCIYVALDDLDFLTKSGLIQVAFNFRRLLESDKEFKEMHGQ